MWQLIKYSLPVVR